MSYVLQYLSALESLDDGHNYSPVEREALRYAVDLIRGSRPKDEDAERNHVEAVTAILAEENDLIPVEHRWQEIRERVEAERATARAESYDSVAALETALENERTELRIVLSKCHAAQDEAKARYEQLEARLTNLRIAAERYLDEVSPTSGDGWFRAAIEVSK